MLGDPCYDPRDPDTVGVMDTAARPEGRTSAWTVLSIVLPIVLGFASMMAAFGLGTACTTEPGNLTVNEPPCDVIRTGLILNLSSQAVTLLVSAVVASRSRQMVRLPRLLVVVSVAAFLVSWGVMQSY